MHRIHGQLVRRNFLAAEGQECPAHCQKRKHSLSHPKASADNVDRPDECVDIKGIHSCYETREGPPLVVKGESDTAPNTPAEMYQHHEEELQEVVPAVILGGEIYAPIPQDPPQRNAQDHKDN